MSLYHKFIASVYAKQPFTIKGKTEQLDILDMLNYYFAVEETNTGKNTSNIVADILPFTRFILSGNNVIHVAHRNDRRFSPNVNVLTNLAEEVTLVFEDRSITISKKDLIETTKKLQKSAAYINRNYQNRTLNFIAKITKRLNLFNQPIDAIEALYVSHYMLVDNLKGKQTTIGESFDYTLGFVDALFNSAIQLETANPAILASQLNFTKFKSVYESKIVKYPEKLKQAIDKYFGRLFTGFVSAKRKLNTLNIQQSPAMIRKSDDAVTSVLETFDEALRKQSLRLFVDGIKEVFYKLTNKRNKYIDMATTFVTASAKQKSAKSEATLIEQDTSNQHGNQDIKEQILKLVDEKVKSLGLDPELSEYVKALFLYYVNKYLATIEKPTEKDIEEILNKILAVYKQNMEEFNTFVSEYKPVFEFIITASKDPNNPYHNYAKEIVEKAENSEDVKDIARILFARRKIDNNTLVQLKYLMEFVKKSESQNQEDEKVKDILEQTVNFVRNINAKLANRKLTASAFWFLVAVSAAYGSWTILTKVITGASSLISSLAAAIAAKAGYTVLPPGVANITPPDVGDTPFNIPVTDSFMENLIVILAIVCLVIIGYVLLHELTNVQNPITKVFLLTGVIGVGVLAIFILFRYVLQDFGFGADTPPGLFAQAGLMSLATGVLI